MADYIFLKKNGQGEDIKISRDEFGKNPNAYRDYTVRMVDKDGTNYDVPFQHISNAVKDGAHVFRMRDNAPKSNVAQQAMDFVSPNKRNPQGVTPKFTDTVEDKEAEFYSDTDKPIYKEVIPEFGSLDIERANRPFFMDAPTKPTEKEKNAKEYIKSVDAGMKKGVSPSYREMIKEAGNPKMNAVQQMQDQLDYISSTGKALSHEKGVEKVMDSLGIAPVVARDEYGKPLLDDKGQILKGTENNEVKANLDSLINQDAKKREEGNYKKTIDEQLRDLYKQKEEIEKKKGRWVPTYSAGFGAGVEDSNQREYKLILDQIDSQIRSLEAVRDKDSMSTLGSMGRALENTAFNPKSWDVGVSDLALMGKISEIKDKTERGEQLTENEKTLAESYIGAQYAAALEDEEMGNAYRWTKIAGESLPFMADFYMTGGYSSLATRGARTGLRLASKMGAKGLKAAVLKNTGVLLGDVAGAYGMALTTQGAKTAADVIKTNVGDMEINDNGEIKFKGGKDALTSLYTGTTKAMVENYTEKLGEHLSFDVPKFFKTAGMENVSRFFTNLQGKNWYKFQNKILKKFGVQNVLSEILEEEAAIPLHALLRTGDSQWSDLIDPKVQADIIGGMVLSVGAMQGAAVAIHSAGTAKSKLNYRKLKNKLNDADWAAENLFREDWGAWKNGIDNTENKDMPMKRLSIKINPNLSEPEKEAVLNYIDLLTEMRGFNLGQNAAMQNKKPLQIRSEIRNINENSGKDKFAVSTFDENGNLVERKKFADEEEANMYKQKMDDINNDNKLKSMYDIVKSGDMTMVETFANDIGISVAEIESIMNKPIYSRTDEEQAILDYLSQIINPIAYPPNVVDEEKAAQDGTELAGTSEVVNANDAQQINERQAAAINKWNEIIQRQPDIDQLITSMQERGYSNNDIAQRLLEDYGSEDITNAFCELCNSSALKDAYINKVGENIDNAVEQHVSEAMFAGQVNGQEDKSNIYQFTDGTNTLILVGGNVTNENGEFSSDGLIVLRDNNGNFVQRDSFEGLSLQGVVPVEQYRQNLLTPLQENATEVIMATEYNDSDMETSQPVAQESNGLVVPEQKTEEAPMPEVPTSNVQEQSEQKQDYPRDENNNLIYDQVPLEVTINDLYDGSLSDEEIRSLVGNNVSNAQKEYEKVQKKAPKIGTDKNKYLEEQKKHKSTVEEAKRKLDYWQTVDDYIKQQTYTTEAEIQKAKDELSGATAQEEYEKNKSDVKSPVQVAGAFIKNAKIQPDSFKKETGYGVTEQRAFSTMISNNGKTIDQLAEDLVSEDNSTNNGAMFHNDTMEAKNSIIEALQGGRQNLGKNTTDDFKEFERNRTQEREDYYQERYGMSYEDFLAFEEQMMPSVWQKMSNFVPEEYDRIVAESYEMQDEANNVEQINNEENGNNTEASEQLAGGNEVLPKEGFNQQGGTTVGANERREDENGGEGGNQNGEVQGSAQQLNNQTGEEESQWNTLSEDEAKVIIQNMEDSAEEYVETELSPESWNNSFDENNSIQTPIGRVKMGDNQISKFLQKKRTKEFGMVAPTLSNPDVIVEERSEAKDGNSERTTSYIFIKTFNRNGEKIKFYASITVKKDGMEVSISSHYMNKNAVEKRLMEDNVKYVKDSLLPNSSDMHLAENQNGLPDLLPSQESNESLSEGKDTTISDTNQENQQKVEEKVEEQPKDDIDAEIKKDIEAFIAQSTHDVQITEYDEKEYEAKISVDGMPSNIVVTPPMENGETMHAEYRPTEGSYQELGDMLDEYNKTVDPNRQGLAGEHLAAIFTSVDAAIAFEDWVNQQNKERKSEKPWDRMTEDEQMKYAFNNPLTEEQIMNAPSDEVNKANAIAYIKGQKSLVTRLSYFKVYKDVKHSTGSSTANNADANTAQLAETNSGSNRGRRVEGEQGGLRDERVDTTSSGQPNSNQGGEQLPHSENGEGRTTDDTGEGGNMEVPGKEQPMGRRDSRSDKPKRGSDDNGNGHNVSKQGGNGRSGKNPDSDRRGQDKADRTGDTGNAELNSESIDSQIDAEIGKFKDLLGEYRNAKKGNGGQIFSTIIPIPVNQQKIEVLGKLIYQGAKVGYLMLRKGYTTLTEWSKEMKKVLAPPMREIEITDTEIDEFVKEMWHCNLPINGETHTIAEWSKIMQQDKLKQAVRTTLEEKKKKQLDAEPVKVKIADKRNIAETLPFLLPLQQEDVYKAEMQFFDDSHNDEEHAYGKGFMFTNGTGTGKTYTGLGIAKRFLKQGKKRILILTPSSTKVNDWVLDATNLNIEAYDLEKWAKAHGTTATTSKAEGVVVTTYANFRQNQALLEDEFDLVIYDESHRLLENKKGEETAGSQQHYMLTNKNEQWAFSRLQTINPVYRKIQETRKRYDEEYSKEKAKYEDANEARLFLPELGDKMDAFSGFPNLKAIKNEYDELVRKYNDEIKPQLEEQAKKSVKNTKVVFLSATPFNTKENLGYAEGYIFQYPDTGGRIGRRSQFYLTNFSAAYRWRYNRLESRTTNPEAVARQEIAFSDYLQNQLGTMSGRVIDSEYDYSRDFPTVTFEKAAELNNAFEEIKKMDGIMRRAFYEVMGNYQYTSALFEAMKTSSIIPRMREQLKAGRKIVLFHRRMETARPITPPFQEILNNANAFMNTITNTKEKNEAKAEIENFKERFAPMFEWEKTLDLRVPRVQITEAFGEDIVLLFSGQETSNQKKAAVEEFNKDSSPKRIIVIQEASGKEGISLHDTTGKNQRVLISLAMPQSPITALQVEGRIYRIGNKSNAIFEYPLLGLDEELITWGQRFNSQVGTTENLALGSKARNLRESFAKAVIEHSGDVPLETQGTGGKEMDESISQDQTDPFDKAVLDYYGNAKTSGRRDNREGKDYYPTPEPLGYMMVQWANLSEGESALEPSAGHGAIARYVPTSVQLTSVEPSTTLFGKLQVLARGIGRKFENIIFENYNIVNKHDVVVMNPPFGTAGRLAVDHVAKAFKHLTEGGRIVAIIPRGATDSKFNKWIETEKTAAVVGEIQLPNITFQNAGTQVACRVVVIDKISNEQMRNEALQNKKQIELPNNYNRIEDFFEDLRGISMPSRTIDQKTKNQKKIMPIVKELKDEYGDDIHVDFTPTGVVLSGTGFDYLDMKGDALKLLVATQYARAQKILSKLPDKFERAKASYEAIKKMALKLADMSEEEMENYVKQNVKDVSSNKTIAERFTYSVRKNTRTGEDMHVVSKNNGVSLTEEEYEKVRNAAKDNGGYWSRFMKGFVFPSELAAKSFLNNGNAPLENPSKSTFGTKYSEDNTINGTIERFDIENGYNSEQLKVLPRESYVNRNGERIVGLKEYIERLRNERARYENEIEANPNTSISSDNNSTESEREGSSAGRYGKSQLQSKSEGSSVAAANDISNTDNLDKGGESYERRDLSRIESLLAEAEAEDNRRLTSAVKLRDKYGIDKDGKISRENLSRMLRDLTNNENDIALFDKLMEDTKHLGIDFRFTYGLGSARGAANIYQNYISYNLDTFTREISDVDKATVIIHELLHQELQSTITAYNSVAFRGKLNNEQKKALNELKKIYDAVKESMPRDKYGIPFYGTKSIHEMISELANPEFREALSQIDYDKKSILQKIIDCIKRILGLPIENEKGNALNGAQQALQKLIENYNPKIDKNWRSKVNWFISFIDGLANKLDYSLFSKVDDKALLDKLNSEPTVKVYRAMQVIDGKLYPPMAAKINGSLVEPTKIDEWYQADEHPELIVQDGTYKDGTPKYKFKLDKGVNDATGKKATDVAAAYNPYWHTSRSPINDQFKSAWIRPNLVTVEVEVPESELTSGYKTQYAKNAVGEVEWKSGSVSSQLAKHGNPRKVILSRYNRVVRVVPVDEVAERFKEMLDGTGIEIPENTVTPQLRAALEAKGVKIGAPEKGVNKNAQIEEALAKGLETDNTLYRRQENQFNTRVNSEPQTTNPNADELRVHAQNLIKQLNVEKFVDIVTSDQLTGEHANAKGFFNPQTGRVTIVLDNNHSKLDIEETILHEVIGHKGLRGLLGNKEYRKLFDAIWSTLSDEQKSDIKEKAMQNGWRYYTAMDEYFAEQAEKMAWDKESHTMWENIRHYVTESLRKLGYIIRPNYKDIRYWLWLSYNNLKSDDVMSEMKRQALIYKLKRLQAPPIDENFNEMKDNAEYDFTEPEVLFRKGNIFGGTVAKSLRHTIDHTMEMAKEAFQDGAISLKNLQEELKKGIKGPFLDNMNAYIGENQIGSKYAAHANRFCYNEVKKLNDKVLEIHHVFNDGKQIKNDVFKTKIKEIFNKFEIYTYKKHGLERNRVLFVRDWFRKQLSIRIESYKELNDEEKYIYDQKEIAIENNFEDGQIDEKDKERLLKQALQEAHIEYANAKFNDFTRLHNRLISQANDNKITLKDVFSQLDAFINTFEKYDPNKHDYSGLTSFFDNGKYNDDSIIDEVMAIERNIGDKKKGLWEAIQNVTQFALDYEYNCGMVTKKTYDRCKSMFGWYIPLRGMKEDTMEDIYSYMVNQNDSGPIPMNAKGRNSQADTPLGVAMSMALNAIYKGQVNLNNQRMYRAANRYQKDNPDSSSPVTVVNVWYVLNRTGEWDMVDPDITDNMSESEVQEKLREYEERMKELEKQGLAKKDKIKPEHAKPFEKKSHKNDHIVYVFVNGERKMIVFNGDPRPARVLRGEMTPDRSEANKLIRFMSKMNTAYNPTFTLRNVLKDSGYSMHNTWVNHKGLIYSYNFLKNQLKLGGDAFAVLYDAARNDEDKSYLSAFRKWKKGEQPVSEMDKMFFEFMENGGATGFVNFHSLAELEDVIKGYKKTSILKKNPLATFIGIVNEYFENLNRFAAYKTARESGKSVMTAINDAKEVSLNFNRRGAADKTYKYNKGAAAWTFGHLAWLFRQTRMFFNPAVQSFYRLLYNLKHHPVKEITSKIIFVMSLGMRIPLFNLIWQAFCGDDGDDKEKYYDLPIWTRRNNICIWNPFSDGWLMIPLAPEMAAFYGMGDLFYGYLFDERMRHPKNPGFMNEMMAQMSQILPLDFMGNEGKVNFNVWETLISLFAGDIGELGVEYLKNKNWLGYPLRYETEWNKYDPEWKKASRNTKQPYIWLSKELNNINNPSSGILKGPIDINPSNLEHFTEGILGGAYKELVNTGILLSDMVEGNLDLNTAIIIRGLYRESTDKTKYQRTNLKYSYYKEEAEKYKDEMNRLKKSKEDKDVLLYAKYIGTEYSQPPKYRRMKIVESFKKYVEKPLYKKIKEENNDEKKAALELRLWQEKKALVEELDQIE